MSDTPYVQGYCHDCGKPLGSMPYYGADWVFCKPCAKAREVYTPPARRP